MQKDNWDAEILDDLFEEADREQIWRIPISRNLKEDTIIWNGEEKGNYSVKSCYRLLRGEVETNNNKHWTRVWKLAIPPKVKNFIWQACSNLLPTADNLRKRKVNCPSGKSAGLGFVLRDSGGNFIAAGARNWAGSYHPKLAEAISIREALKWSKEKGYNALQIESNALLVIQGLKNAAYDSYFDLVLEDIRVLANEFDDISFSFVKRSANTVAHLIAREAVFNADCRAWDTTPPSFIYDVIRSEAY
nr:uncharacterized protein LOC109177106 [Ipomoea batatas]